ncbi:recombinase RecT [Apilactobacillus timberlakei]|uniref:recombinase RecT n=1 Tax=Apilactobacillus timberlakei TaxID=2008380 RepID=UPI001126521C|nr:recombinase RecT [Apilactobacillus timberlakei]TPR16674.1 recombinase RecT [Apilactobacillus timberlakei]
MTNQINPATTPVKNLVKLPGVQKMLNDSLKDRAPQFMTSVVSIVDNNHALQDVDQMSVIQAAMIATSLNLPINQNLGFMWLVPYKEYDQQAKQYHKIAQAQIGYKGYIQLAIRTGQYQSLNAVAVHEGELRAWNPLTEDFDYDPTTKISDKVIGYAGFFQLNNGFKKTVYWTKEQMEQHKNRFSKMYKRSPWNSDYDAMAIKTVIRNMLSKWGIMSTEMVTALTSDEQTPEKVDVEESDASTEDEQPKDITELGKGKKNAETDQNSNDHNSKSQKNDGDDNPKQKDKSNNQGQKLNGKDSDHNGNI